MIMYFKTVQSGAFKTLIEVLKEVFMEVNFIFDSNGIRMSSMDSTHTVMVKLNLEAKNFEEYHCPNRFRCGVPIANMFKLLKVISNNDVISMFVERTEAHRLCIEVSNAEKNTITNYKLNMIDIDEEIYNIPDVEFESVMTMPSQDLQRILRDMGQISQLVRLCNTGNKFILSCQGDFAEQQTVIQGQASSGAGGNGVSFVKGATREVSGRFSLEKLNQLVKSASLCSNVEIYLKEKFALILVYHIASLGEIKYIIAPKIDQA